ncbi:TPA: hypothetical protein PC505_003922 [Morganella morganii]|nr:hypothetical protein [Morganella morganii]HDF2424467.1 hypothetical protein [Morganella morganii]
MKRIGKKTSTKRLMKWFWLKFLYLVLGCRGARRRLELARQLRILNDDEGGECHKFATIMMGHYKEDRNLGRKKAINFWLLLPILIMLFVVFPVFVPFGTEHKFLSLVTVGYVIIAAGLIYRWLKM